MEHLREMWIDQPMNSLDRAMWWIEYVIRHKGTSHLRTPYSDISWIEYLLLDVVLVITLVSLTAIYFLILITKCICNLMFFRRKYKTI